MSNLLYLPGILVILVKRRGLATTLRLVITMFSLQALIAMPFLREHPWPYLKNAFDLSRIFLYKWTVNWRFVDEETFLSASFAKALLLGHLSVLVAFGAFQWCRKDGGLANVFNRALRFPARGASPATISPDGLLPFHLAILRLIFRCRGCDHPIHIQFDRHTLCAFIALSILFMVCPTTSVPCMANAISDCGQVRLILLSPITTTLISSKASITRCH